MAWRVELSEGAKRSLRKLDPTIARRITRFLRERAAEEPRSLGEPLRGPLSGYWKYRVGEYRIICEIRDRELVILAVQIGNRREVYR